MGTENAGTASAVLAASGQEPAAAPTTTAQPAPAAAPDGTTPAPTTTPAAPATSEKPTEPAAKPDYSWAGDDAAKAMAEKKGWATPADAFKSYTELEGLLGGEKLPLPKQADDKAGWDRVYNALGRPDTADGYGLKPPEGIEPTVINEFAAKAHELGLSTKQAQEIQKWHDSKAMEIAGGESKETTERIDQEIAQVQKDWGQNFNINAEVARRGADALGLDKDALDAMEESPKIGHKKLMDMLFKVGQATGEASAHGMNNSDKTGFGAMSKEQAQARRDEIIKNPAERAEAMKAGTEVSKELDRLDMIIAGKKPK